MIRRGALGTGAVAAVATVIVACSTFSSDGTTSSGPDEAGAAVDTIDGGQADVDPVSGGPPIHISASGPPRILVGNSLQVTIAVTREGPDGFGGPVHVELAPTPDMTFPPIDVPAGEGSATATLTVGASRRHGRIGLSFVATSPSTPSKGSALYTLLVRGPVGALDTGFGVGGIVSLGVPSVATGLVVDGGKIALGGRIGPDLAVARFNEDGTRDMSFAAAGVLRVNIGTLVSTQELIGSATALYLGATIDNGIGTNAILAGITGAGALRASGFGSNGVASVPLTTGTALSAIAVAGYPGTFLVGGRRTSPTPAASVILLKADGSPSAAFGGDSTLIETDDCPGSDKSACRLGAIAVAKTSVYACAFRKDGSLVFSNVGGSIYTSLYIDTCTSLAVDTAGRIYVGGDSVGAAAVSRYKSDGSRDDTWAVDSPLASAPAGSNLTLAKKILVQPDGTLIVAGDATVGTVGGMALWRLRSDGTTDTDFAPPNGFATKAIASTNIVVSAMALDADGRVVIAGGNGEMIAARFWQ